MIWRGKLRGLLSSKYIVDYAFQLETGRTQRGLDAGLGVTGRRHLADLHNQVVLVDF